MGMPAIVTAGDQRAARAVRGRSKVYLEIEGRPLVAHVVAVLQRVPEISEVWVVGDAERLGAVFGRDDVALALRKPLHVVPQFRNLYENAWQTYRRTLPGAGPEGRDPGPDDLDRPVLYVSGDIPLATPQEISEFVRRSLDLACDYAVGLVTEASLEEFYPRARGERGIRMAYFNLREGRFRQSNLHFARPARIGNRYYIEDMYEHRHQKEFREAAGLAWRLLRSEQGGLRIVFYYCLMHLAGLANRAGWQRLADRLRHMLSISRVEAACSALLRTRYRFVVTDVGGCALDVDTERDYDVLCRCFAAWRKAQLEKAEHLYGPLALPERASEPRH